MYKIYCDNTCIFNDKLPIVHTDSNDRQYLITPRLILEENTAGTLAFSISSKSSCVSNLMNPKKEIWVVRTGFPDGDKELWRGRILSYSKDFNNYISFVFEGELAYLNDVVLTQKRYANRTIRQFVEDVLSRYNSQVASNRQLTLGIFSITDNRTTTVRYTDYETPIEVLQKYVIDEYEAKIRITYNNGTRTLDIVEEYAPTTVQTANFGVNLLDYTESFETTDFASVIIPLGASQSTPVVGDLTAYLTVSSVNGGSVYVSDSTLLSQYGRIEKVVHFDEIESAADLLTEARRYLTRTQFSDLTLNVSMVDLGYMGVRQTQLLNILSKVKVKSEFHGIETAYPVTRLEIAMDDPTATRVTLGKVRKGRTISELRKQVKNKKK